MRSVVLLVLLVGCSSLLGIEDPAPADGGVSLDRLEWSLGDLRIAQNQVVQLHVRHVHPDSSSEDVTASADYSTNDPAIATVEPGRITAGAQAGTAIITASLGDAAQATVMVTVASTLCSPVINEVQTASTASQDDEWVEIYNACSTAVDVTGWTLNYRSASAAGPLDSGLMVTLAGLLAPGEIRLYAGPAYGDTADGKWTGATLLAQTTGGVGLRRGVTSTSPLVDAIAYGNVAGGHPFIETSRAPALVTGRSAARLPFDGKDDGDGAADFMIVMTPTPRALNAP